MDMKIYEYYLLFRKNMEMKMSGFECETVVLFFISILIVNVIILSKCEM